MNNRRQEGKDTGAALRELLKIPANRQPYIAIRTTKPNMITEAIKIDPINSKDENGEIQLGCRSVMWNGIRYWYWSDDKSNVEENEITWVEVGY